MDVSLLTQADFVLSKCGRPEAPDVGLAVDYIGQGILVQTVFPAATGNPQQTITKEIKGDTAWCLRDMQLYGNNATSIKMQILKPDGRFLFNDLIDVLQLTGYGSFRYLWTVEQFCPVGSRIQVTFLVTDTSQQQPISIVFGGAYQYLLKSGVGRICGNYELAGKLPRYFGNHAENIMAPAWQQGVSHYTPPGYFDEEFVYAVQVPTAIDVNAAIATATQQIQIPPNEEAHIRKCLFFVTADQGVTSGIFKAKIRSGSGYTLTDDYIDVARYIGSSPMPKNWIVAPEDSVYIDLQLVDQSGAGSMIIATALEGFRRRRKV
jgi:hypothetical protein